jgi:hypothetical protein
MMNSQEKIAITNIIVHIPKRNTMALDEQFAQNLAVRPMIPPQIRGTTCSSTNSPLSSERFNFAELVVAEATATMALFVSTLKRSFLPPM